MQTRLFLRKTRTDPDDVNYVSLDNADVGEVLPTQGLQLLLFTIALLLLLGQTLVAFEKMVSSSKQ
jgi:hypothetical protein